MKEVTAVTALAIMNDKWVISKNHENIFRVHDDREYFNRMTMGKIVVYGINTLQTLPNAKPLANRTNIILTHDRDVRISGAITVGSIKELEYVLKGYSTDDVYLIGGEKTFAELIDECKTAILTVVNDDTDGDPEVFQHFPNLKLRDNWMSCKESSEHYYQGLRWTRKTYVNTRFRKHLKSRL